MRKPLLILIGVVALLAAVLAVVWFVGPFTPATTAPERGAAATSSLQVPMAPTK